MGFQQLLAKPRVNYPKKKKRLLLTKARIEKVLFLK